MAFRLKTKRKLKLQYLIKRQFICIQHTTIKNHYLFPPQICFHTENVRLVGSLALCHISHTYSTYQSDVNPSTKKLHLHMHTAGDGWVRICLCIFYNPAYRKQQSNRDHFKAPNTISRTPLWPQMGRDLDVYCDPGASTVHLAIYTCSL